LVASSGRGNYDGDHRSLRQWHMMGCCSRLAEGRSQSERVVGRVFLGRSRREYARVLGYCGKVRVKVSAKQVVCFQDGTRGASTSFDEGEGACYS
jgi:hypothetical protein